jgi:hypothetical protein
MLYNHLFVSPLPLSVPKVQVHWCSWPEKMPIWYFKTAYTKDKQGNGPGTAKYFDFLRPSLHLKYGVHFHICLMLPIALNLQWILWECFNVLEVSWVLKFPSYCSFSELSEFINSKTVSLNLCFPPWQFFPLMRSFIWKNGIKYACVVHIKVSLGALPFSSSNTCPYFHSSTVSASTLVLSSQILLYTRLCRCLKRSFH